MKYVIGTIQFLCAMSGFILMMCETPNFDDQLTVLTVGAVLFLIGVLPTIFKQAIRESYEAD